MPVESHEAIILILDTGKSVSIVNDGEEKSFFHKSKECVSWIIQRKLISQSPDVLALVLIGSDDVSNSVASSGYDNVCCKFDFQHASWEMLKFVELELKTTENESDWFGGMTISVEMLKVYEEFNSVENKKIVLFSDFVYDPSVDLNVLFKNLESSHINVSIIGPENIFHLIESSQSDHEPVRKKQKNNFQGNEREKGEEFVSKMWKRLPDQIVICSFESALKQLCAYTRKTIRKTPWNCILDIGDVRIKISMLKKTDPKLPKKFVTKYVKSSGNESESSRMQLPSQLTEDDVAPVIRDKILHYKQQTSVEGQFIDVEVKEEDTVEGFRYGATIVPFSDADKEVMGYKPGEKCFSVIGFTNISSVPFYLFSGECSYVVQARENDEDAELALSAIIQAMKHMECLAIVRKVYSKDRGLSLGVLYPFIEEFETDDPDEISSKECLLYIDLAFAEDIKSINFPSLENASKEVTEEQYAAIDDLIESMDLMNADKGLRGEPAEALDLFNLHDFKEQFFHYCVIQRGLHPDNPLPKTLPTYIEEYKMLPKSISENSKGSMNKIKDVFKVSEIRKFQRTSETPGTSTQSQNDGNNWEVRRIQHFTQTAIDQEENSIKRKLMELFSTNFPELDELETCLREFSQKESDDVSEQLGWIISKTRLNYLDKNPDMFNWWMTQFKGFCHGKTGPESDTWDFIVAENQGLVSDKENKYSRVSENEAEDFLHAEITKSLTCHTPIRKRTEIVGVSDSMELDSSEIHIATAELI
ncbi:hypothetical protein RUM43_002370 [Polyplax serrata]|uniref:Ku domain-containing protein n=1 Tax=Polyplax serrata TaxID=468196 RepID=A0AAN8P270_POLSC